ncbi:MAG: hypothetical protein NC102_03970, partial [Clostridium sp.]|nr:hypothetical protein [Clostridium sp.]
DGSGAAGLTGARTAGPVMFDVFNLLPHSGWFCEPSEGEEAIICTHSGHLAGKYCAETEIRMVAKAGLNSEACPYCQELPVSMDGRRRVENGSEPMEMRAYFTLPPLMKYFYKQHHAGYLEPPAGQGGEGQIKIIYPGNGAVVSMPKDEENALVFKATHANAGATLFWHMDDDFAGATGDLHQIQVNPGPGPHRLAVVDESGAQAVAEFVVR